MSTITAHGELPDGTTWAGLTVPVASRIQWETTARNNKWTIETHPLTFSTFLSWHAAKRAGRHTLTWEEFVDTALDAGVKELEDKDDPEGPTTPSESPSTA